MSIFCDSMMMAASEPPKVLVLIDRTAGGAIGSMAFLPRAFDGNTNQTDLNCSYTSSSVSSSYIGKTLAAPRTFGRAVVYGANNNGFVRSSNPAVTLTVRGKNGSAPSGGADGTALGALTFTDTGNESAGRIVDSTDLTTAWDHLWVHISAASGVHCCAELILYAWETEE